MPSLSHAYVVGNAEEKEEMKQIDSILFVAARIRTVVSTEFVTPFLPPIYCQSSPSS